MKTIRVISKIYKIPERALRIAVKKNLIPFTRIGNRVYISEDWIKNKLATDGCLW